MSCSLLAILLPLKLTHILLPLVHQLALVPVVQLYLILHDPFRPVALQQVVPQQAPEVQVQLNLLYRVFPLALQEELLQ